MRTTMKGGDAMFWLVQAALVVAKYTIAPSLPWWAVLLPLEFVVVLMLIVMIFAVLGAIFS